jgi:hypothetical protein
MMKKINSYDELVQRQHQVQELLGAQKELVKYDFEQLKTDLKPASVALKFVSNITTLDKRNPLINEGIDKVVDLVLKKVILARSGWITKLLIPFLVKNYSSHVIGDHKDEFIDKIFSLVSGSHSNGDVEKYEHNGAAV